MQRSACVVDVIGVEHGGVAESKSVDVGTGHGGVAKSKSVDVDDKLQSFVRSIVSDIENGKWHTHIGSEGHMVGDLVSEAR